MVQALAAQQLAGIGHPDLHRSLPFKHGHDQLDEAEFPAVQAGDAEIDDGVRRFGTR